MKKMKRLLAVILASLLILSSATAAASAYKYDSYKDGKLTKYDFTDSAVLTTEQYASMLLDYADEALAKENITMDLSILGKLDATSIDNALSSVYKLIDSNGAILNLAGDLKHVKVSAIKDARRSNGTDVAVINSLLQFLADNNPIIKKVVLGGIGKQRRDGGVSLGVANSFVKVDLNIEVMLRELLWGLAYPNTAYNSSTTVDTMLQTIIQNALAGVPIIPESVRNLVDLNSTKSTYDFIEDLLQTAYNDMAVPMLNEQVIPWLEMQIRCDETGTLADLFNTGYQVQTYTVPAGKTLIGELNNIAGQIVNGLLKGYTGWVDGDNSKLTDNVVSVARFVLKKTGGYFFPDWQKHIATPEEIDAMSKEELIAYIARSVINASVGYMYIPEDVTTVVGVTWEAVKQLMAQFLPERDYSNYPKTIDGILDMLADYVAYNVNPGIDLNAGSLKEALNYGDGLDKMLTTAVQWLKADPQFYTGLLPDTTVDTSNGWKALDDIIFKLLDKSLLPAKFADSGSETILKDVVYSVLKGLILNQDLTCLTDLFERNQNGAFAKQTVKKSIVRLVTDILNAIIPGTITTKYYDSLDAIVKNNELANIVENLISSLNGNKGKLVPPIVNIVAQVMGLADKSKFGQMKFTGPTRASDAYTVTIYNGSKGINRGYTDKNGNFTQDALYKYRIASVSATAYNMAGNGTNVGVSGVKAGDIINGGFSKDIAVSKPGATDTTVVLTVGYFILTENGESLTGTTPLYASYYTYYSSDTQDDSEPKDIETITGKLRLVKPRAGFINQNEALNKIDSVRVRINRVKDAGHLTKSTYTQNASTFKNNSGTFFKDVGFSGETENENTNITEILWEAKAGADRTALADGTYTIDYSVKGTRTASIGGKTGTVSGSASIFVYNDYEVPAKYSQYSGEQRQRANYSADADAEWAEYQAALIAAANYSLRPKLKANFSNASYLAAYQTISTRLTAAAEALDAKMASASVDSLKTAVEAVQGAPNPEGSVYWDQGYNFFGYDDFNSVSWNGWKEARNRAMNLYNSTKAPEEPVAPEHPGEGANECQLATYNKKYAQWEKDHAAWETKMATWKAPTISSVDVAYAEQQIALWGPRLIKLDAVKTHLDAAIAMCTINPADASKYDAERWEAYSQAFAYAQNVSTSFNASTTMRTQVREAMNNLIYNWKRLIANPVVTVTFTFTVNGEVHAVLTGNQGDPVDLSSIEAPAAPVGMHFVSWGNVPATFDADASFEAVFANNTDTKYTVNVYNMDTTGAYPSAPDSTYQGAGETGSTADITADAAPAEGFSLDSAKSVLTGTIAADGSLVLSIYYSRNQYTVTYANTDLVPDTYYYGATVVARTPEKAGHTFLGWEEEVPATMPANNVVLTAKWDELPANYDEYNIAVEAANAKKAEADYDKKYTADTRAALDTALNEDVSGKKLSEQHIVDAQTAKINAAVAGLKLMTYNAEFYVDNELYRTVATEVGAQIVAPEAPTKEGYTFTGWNPEVGVMGVENVRFDAKFSAGTVGYKVETYVMGLDGNYGDAAIEDKSATTGETVSVTPETREGFTVADNSVLSGTVLADGSLVLKVYYSRNQYKLSVDGAETDVYYGAALNVAEPAAREGYTFAGWNMDIPATMPAENLTLVSQWNENDADYSAYNAAVAAAQAKQGEENYDKKYTAETRAALAAVLAEDVSGKKYSEQGVVDAATKAINDAVAGLELMTYTATFYVDGAVHATVQTKVGEQIAKPEDPTKTGYVFTGWDPEVGVMGVENVSFNAQFSAGEVSYTVETYVMGLDGEYGAAETKNVPATTGAEVTLTPDAREGFTVAGDSVLSGTVAADSSLTLKVYYSRNQYKLTVDGAESDVYFGAALEIANPAPREGYTFTGWNVEIPATMPAEDLTLVSQWSENDADYTAYNAAVAAAQAKQGEENYDKKYTAETRAALAAVLAEDVSGKKYSEQGVVDAATKAINDAVAGLELMTYTATFYVDGAVHATVQTKVGEQIVAPADPAKEGYIFKGWDKEVGKMGVEDVSFNAEFEEATGIAYTVEVYTMDVNGNYGAAETKTLYGTTGATVNADTTAAEGFTFDESADNVVSGEIAADGSLVLKVYFARNQYKLTVDGVETDVYYGAALNVAEPAAREGYTFAGWNMDIPATMPAENLTLVSQWNENDADYSAYNAAVAAAQAKQGEENYDKKYTAETRAALAAVLAEDVSGKKYSEQGVVDAATKAINDAVAGLELMTYTATFYVDGAVHATVQTKVGEQIVAPADPAKEGYIFKGWDKEVGKMGVEDVSFNAEFEEATGIAYTVEVYTMDVNGNYGAAETKTLYGTTGATVNADTTAAEGFTFDESADNVVSGEIAADGSLVLKVYFARNQYKLTVDGVETDVYYGAALNVAEPAAREGYTFAGWNMDIPATMPAENLTLVSQWNENDADYSAYNAAVAAAQAKQGEENYDKKYTAETRAALAAVLAEDVSGKKYSEQGVVDAATKAINDAVAGLELMTYTATFYVDGAVHATVQTKVGEQIVAPADPAKEGYIFKGWDKEVGKMGVEDVSFNAEFEEATGIAYTVEVYTMDVNGNYGAAETKTLYGTTGATVNADTTAAEGFTFDESADNVVSGEIAADGSLVLKVYFARNQYKLTVDGVETDVYYGAALNVAEPAAREGYTFAGWNMDIPATMPAENLTLVSQWNENDADYSAYNAAVAAAQAKQGEENYDKKYTAETRAALAAVLAEDVSGKKYSEQGVVDAATKAINDAVAGLELMTYTATFYVDGAEYKVVTAKVGEQIIAPENPTKEGFVFTGWDKEVGVMGTEDVSFNAQFSAGEVSYKVETYVMDVNGAYGAVDVKVVPATTGAAVSVDPEAREGFTVAADSILSGTVAADSSLVLKVYYSRNQYKLTVDGAESDVYFGAALEIANPAPREGYTFTGWNVEIPATMPAEDLTLVSQWSENDADYTAYNAAVAAAQAKQGEENYDKKYTAETRAALAAVLAEDVSGKKYSEQGVVDAATQAINDAVAALELMTYTATFYVNGEVHATVTAKVGEQIAAPADPIVDGYSFTGWDPEVGTMGIENVSFNAILVANDSSIISVTPESPNYGGMHQYAIKVKGEPQKIRIVDAFGNTRTFDRNTSMTSDANALGILKIEKTDDGEIWTINVNIPEGRYVAFAKFGKDWEENGHNFSVRFDVKPEEPTPDGVLEVTYNTPNYGGKQEYTFKVSGKADKIQVVCADGGTTTLSRLDPRVTVKSYDAEGIEVYSNSTNLAYEIWTVNLDIPAGRHIAKAKYGRSWTAGTEFDVIIDAKPVSAVSVTEVKASADSVEVTVNGTATKIKIADASGATRTYDRDHADVSIAPDGDGEIWTINAKLRAGEYTATAKYIANDRQVWDTTDFAFTV